MKVEERRNVLILHACISAGRILFALNVHDLLEACCFPLFPMNWSCRWT